MLVEGRYKTRLSSLRLRESVLPVFFIEGRDFYLFLRWGLSLNLGLTDLASLASPGAPGIPLSPPSGHRD